MKNLDYLLPSSVTSVCRFGKQYQRSGFNCNGFKNVDGTQTKYLQHQRSAVESLMLPLMKQRTLNIGY